MKQRTALVSLAAAACLAGFVLWVLTRGAEDPAAGRPEVDIAGLDFPPFALDAPAFVRAWELERAGLGEPSEAVQAYLDAWHRHNFAVALSRKDLFDGDLAAIAEQLAQSRRDAVAVRSAQEILSMGWYAFESFSAALDALLEAARAGGTSVSQLLEDPLNPIAHAAYESCGDFLEGALRAGIIKDTGALTIPPELLAIMFRHRWVLDFRDRLTLESTVPAAEQRELARWRIEDAELDLEARLNAIAQYDREHGFDAYSAPFARAVAYAQAGQVERARMELALGAEQPTE